MALNWLVGIDNRSEYSRYYLDRFLLCAMCVCVCVAICFFENFGNDSIFYPKCNCLLATNVETTIYFISINENELKNYGSIEYINKKGIRRY